MSFRRVPMGMLFRSFLMVLSFVLVFVFAFTNVLLAQTGSNGSGQASGALPTSERQVSGPDGGGVGGLLSLVPYISVSERYDSNILYIPDALEDYVTNISAGARANYRGDIVTGTLTGGLTSEVYVRNPGLNYMGFNASLNAVFDKAVERVVRGLGLSISDRIEYTPRLQSWLTPEVSSNNFISGIQAVRNNSLTNAANILSTYWLNSSDQMRASYSNEMIRFFSSPAVLPGARTVLFNTDIHGFLTGVDHHFNRTDSIGVSYQFQQMSFEPSAGGPGGMSAVVNGVMATWKISISRELTAEVSPGASLVSSLPGELQWTMLANLNWQGALTAVRVSYTRGIFPGFFLAGGALISDVVGLQLSRNLTSHWSVGSQANYSTSSSLGAGSANVEFESYGASAFMNYTFYQGIVAAATATWDRFIYGGASTLDQVVNRQTVMLSIRAEWN